MKHLKLFKTLVALMLVAFVAACCDDDPAEPSKPEVGPSKPETESESYQLNKFVHKYLSERYLWNEEYKKLNLNFNEDYEDFFYGALERMKTNTLDLKPYVDGNGQTRYTLFSYIQKLPTGTDTRNEKIDKEQTYSFGFINALGVNFGEGKLGLCIQGVYPDSPAAKAGIKRGHYITEIDGLPITESNIEATFQKLVLPSSQLSAKLTFGTFTNNNLFDAHSAQLQSEFMYCNPILYHDVITDYPQHTIGYLVYNGFDAGFDPELFDVFKAFKNQNVTDLILDFRYNGGGHVISANLIASCIAADASKGKVFAQYRYNDSRMAAMGNKRPTETFSYEHYANLKSALTDGGLNLKRIYCITGNATASASELVINALRGIDIEVVLVGERTHGKNVGMEYTDHKVNNDTYRIVPITFQTYNAKGFGDYEKGFEPDIAIHENDTDNDGYFDDFKDFGDKDEALLARTIQEITGQQLPTIRRSTRVDSGRIVQKQMPLIHRPLQEGMLKKAE